MRKKSKLMDEITESRRWWDCGSEAPENGSEDGRAGNGPTGTPPLSAEHVCWNVNRSGLPLHRTGQSKQVVPQYILSCAL